MALTIRYITSTENAIWDQLINSSPQGSVFLLSDCLYAYVDSAPELHLLRLGCFDDIGNLVGGQTFLYKKKAVFRIQAVLYSWDYINTPVIAGHIAQSSKEYFDIIQALAGKAENLFFSYEVFCHPSIQDIRPLLQRGWSSTPYYTHMWSLHERGDLLTDLTEKNPKRFRQAESVFKALNFEDETGEAIIEEFIPLYQENARHIGFKLIKSWADTFRALANQMLEHNYIRFFTCRKKDGDLLGIATYVLDPIRDTAYGWQFAHVPMQSKQDFVPAFYLYAIKILSNETGMIDISEGVRSSLYYFKDSLGTKSVPLFAVQTPNSEFLEGILKKIKKGWGVLKSKIGGALP